MNRWRILLLVILALLLPVRGVLASVSHCGSAEAIASMAAAGHGHSSLHHHAAASGHPAEHAGHAAVPTDDHSQAHAAGEGHEPAEAAADAGVTCKLCASSCAGTAVLRPTPTFAAPLAVADLRFPLVNPPPPSHPSDGLERPPRSA